MAFKQLKADSFEDETQVRFETAGQQIEGYYLGTVTFTSPKTGETYTKHRFRSDTGELISCLTTAVLSEDLARVPTNTMTRLTYNGMVKTKKGRSAKSFTIEVDSDNVLQAS